VRESNGTRVGSITTALESNGAGRTIEANAAKAISALNRLKSYSPDLLVLPEGFLYAGVDGRKANGLAGKAAGGMIERFQDAARNLKSYLAVPFLESADGGAVLNAVALLRRDGSRIGTYYKRILWPTDHSLSDLENGVTPGVGGGPFQTDFGPIGIQTCLEVHWPSPWKALKEQGANLILYPSEQSGGAILRNRAWETRCYVISAVSKGGPSETIGPTGITISRWWPRTYRPLVDLHLDYEIVHLDHNEPTLYRLAKLLTGLVRFDFLPHERLCITTSLTPRIAIKDMLATARVPTLDAYLERIAQRHSEGGSFVASTAVSEGRGSDVERSRLRSVSVVVPTRGDSPALRRCLSALSEQQFGLPVEIVVVANGPSASLFDSSLPGVKVILEPKRGPAAARNRGVKESTGDCIAFIDDDCIAGPLWLSAAVSALSMLPVDVVVAGAITRSGYGRNMISLFDSITYLQQENYVRFSAACVTANVVLARRTFERLGFFNELFVDAACEDWEWASRAKQLAIPIVFEKAAAVDHPCMETLRQLRLKAERLARGELLLRSMANQQYQPPTLPRAMLRSLKQASKSTSIPPVKRLALYYLSAAVALWMWRATRNLTAC
jgi:predicted amidohydrolase/GT2 family glycosyltransferase